MSNFTEGLKLETSAVYGIKVRGEPGELWSSQFGHMQIINKKRDGLTVVTSLKGKVRDQAELIGILKSLHDLRLFILSVKLAAITGGSKSRLGS